MIRIQPEDLIAALAARATLDVRSPREFDAGHLPGSGHIPVTELALRRGELPPRDRPLLVIAEHGAAALEAAAILAAMQYDVGWLDGDPSGTAAVDRAPARRLWRPSPFLEAVLPRLPQPGAGPVRVVDLAAGAGRESVHLAGLGFTVEAWDHDRGALERAAALAAREGVPLDTRVVNLEAHGLRLPEEAFDLAMVFRFLHRPLLPALGRLVVPGGRVLYETFLRGQERFGRPRNPRFLLDPGELPGHFPGFAIEHYEELRPPEGPWLARLLACRPTDASSPAPAEAGAAVGGVFDRERPN